VADDKELKRDFISAGGRIVVDCELYMIRGRSPTIGSVHSNGRPPIRSTLPATDDLDLFMESIATSCQRI
jgi:hypothetical protein